MPRPASRVGAWIARRGAGWSRSDPSCAHVMTAASTPGSAAEMPPEVSRAPVGAADAGHICQALMNVEQFTAATLAGRDSIWSRPIIQTYPSVLMIAVAISVTSCITLSPQIIFTTLGSRDPPAGVKAVLSRLTPPNPFCAR